MQIIAGGDHNNTCIIPYDRVVKGLYLHGKAMTVTTKVRGDSNDCC